MAMAIMVAAAMVVGMGMAEVVAEVAARAEVVAVDTVKRESFAADGANFIQRSVLNLSQREQRQIWAARVIWWALSCYTWSKLAIDSHGRNQENFHEGVSLDAQLLNTCLLQVRTSRCFRTASL